jgi:DNA polymerase III epsilon subunit-like protein
MWELAVIRDNLGFASEYQWFIKPDLTTADPMALRIGGYYLRTAELLPPLSRKQGRKWSDPAKAAAQLAGLLDGVTLVAANPAFDAAFIAAFLRRHGHVLTCDYHYRDIGTLVTGWVHGYQTAVTRLRPGAMGGVPHLPKKQHLADMAAVAGVDPAGYDTHTALGDTRLARDIYVRVTGGEAA